MDQVRQEPPKDGNVPVQVAGDPEKRAAAQRLQIGIELSASELEEFIGLAREHQISMPAVLKADPV